MEINAQHRFEKVIVVYSPPDAQIERLVERNGLSKQAALDRLGSQMPIDEKVKTSDFVIDNTGSFEETRRQVKRVYQVLKILEICVIDSELRTVSRKENVKALYSVSWIS